MKYMIPSFLITLFLVSCVYPGSSLGEEKIEPGKYSIDESMYKKKMENLTIALKITDFVINEDYSAVVFCTWSVSGTFGTYDYISKSSDSFNPDMYLYDDLNNKYPIYYTTGAAEDGCSLRANEAANGTFIFVGLDPNARRIVFRDDDQSAEMILFHRTAASPENRSFP